MQAIITAISDVLVTDSWLTAFTIFVVCFFGLKLIALIIKGRLSSLAARTATRLDDVVIETLDAIWWPFYIFVPLSIALSVVRVAHSYISFLNAITFIVVVLSLVGAVRNILVHVAIRLVKLQKGNDRDTKLITGLLSKTISFVLWIIAFVLILQNLGLNVSALVGGLGIMGIAVGFALQNVLGEFFSFFSIYFDKPFVPGDFITMGTDKGTVEKIGVKTTRIRTPQGEQLVVSNADLTSSRINNFKKMEERRVQFTLGVEYETSVAKLKKVPVLIEKIITDHEHARFDRTVLIQLGDSALVFEVVYFVTNPDFEEHLAIQHAVLMEIIEVFTKEKISFAYPTQKVWLGK